MLREGLKIFLRHFLLPKKRDGKQNTEAKDMKIRGLVEIAEAALDDRDVNRF